MLHVSHRWFASLALLPVSYYSGTHSKGVALLENAVSVAERKKVRADVNSLCLFKILFVAG